MGADVELVDNSEQFLDAMDTAMHAALEAMGLLAENYAKGNITAASRIDMGNMKNSVAHTVKDGWAFVGTNNEYAV